MITLDLTTLHVESRERYLRLLRKLDPFQELGIPCWRGVAGPLHDPNEPDGDWAEND